MRQRPEEEGGGLLDEAPKHHVHHSYMWLGSLRIAGIILFSAAISIGSSLIGIVAKEGVSAPGDTRVALVVLALCALLVLLIVVVVVVYQVLSYKHLYYQLTPTEFSLFKGVLSKKRVHVPYQRIQSVDQRASLFQRIAGVCTVSIDTAGGSSNKAVVVPYLTRETAEGLRAELLRRCALASLGAASGIASGETEGFGDSEASWALGAPPAAQGQNVLDAPAQLWERFGGVFGGAPGGAPGGMPGGATASSAQHGTLDAFGSSDASLGLGGHAAWDKPSFEYGLTNKELVLAGLSNNTTFALVVIGVLAAIVQLLDGAFSIAPSTSSQLLDAAIAGATGELALWVVAGAVTGVLGIIALIWVLSAVGECVSYGGFKARRRGNRIEVERGLLQHRFQGVDIERVQSVTVKQSFVRRLMGCCEITIGKIDTVSDGGEGSRQSVQQQGMVLHPFVKVDRVADILAGLLPEYADVPHETLSVGRAALRRAIVRRGVIQGFGFWLALIVAVCQLTLHVLAPSAGADLVAALPSIDMAAKVSYALAFVLFVIDVAGAVLWARESSFGFNDRFLQINLGGFSRETTSLLRRKIQFGYVKANPLQRRAGTATLNARTAAGVGGTTLRLIDVREEDAAAWLAWLKPRPRSDAQSSAPPPSSHCVGEMR